MSDIVEFLRARLDEDEQTATAAVAATFGGCPTWTSKDDGTGRQTHGYAMADHTAICGHDGDDVLLPVADHIARHDPARVLREVEAKRRVINGWSDPFGNLNAEQADAARVEKARVLHSLAAVYSDHPEYQQEWAIS
ncbi:hypothetical protein GS445_06580 [Rhodococcus hoagii]|uniref:Uncharacterized protein n=1 Tax=Rhodococcus hoagii TaxID=43767 RepID=A0A9Q4ZKI7_RHOHA|nr:DUF6221 family protein [Prescottella equi]MBM4549356.1 hypothetical protein [Prescottella equi]MBM4708234.1 hypothetical protein [Prescottella equi]NKT78230.1 hypothetical protein [Prescottella equi]